MTLRDVRYLYKWPIIFSTSPSQFFFLTTEGYTSDDLPLWPWWRLHGSTTHFTQAISSIFISLTIQCRHCLTFFPYNIVMKVYNWIRSKRKEIINKFGWKISLLSVSCIFLYISGECMCSERADCNSGRRRMERKEERTDGQKVICRGHA